MAGQLQQLGYHLDGVELPDMPHTLGGCCYVHADHSCPPGVPVRKSKDYMNKSTNDHHTTIYVFISYICTQNQTTQWLILTDIRPTSVPMVSKQAWAILTCCPARVGGRTMRDMRRSNSTGTNRTNGSA